MREERHGGTFSARRVRRALLAAAVTAIAVLSLAGSASAASGGLKIALLYDGFDDFSGLRADVLSQPGVAQVDLRDIGASTPSASDLAGYDVVFVTDDDYPDDRVGLGNTLADYQDAGGVVVAAEFLWEGGGDDIGGRWVTDGYNPYVPTATDDNSHFRNSTLGTHDPSSLLLAGVSSLRTYYREAISLNSGATEIAQWDDGISAVAYKGNAVGINGYADRNPGPGNPNTWDPNYAKIIVNAAKVRVLTVSRTGSGVGGVTSAPAGIDCGVTCVARFAPGTSVTLTATPVPGSTFGGWSGGGCAGTAPTCVVPLDVSRTVTAAFNVVVPALPAPILRFAGLQFKPQTLTVRHGRVQVALTCPASSVGNCIGTDTLTSAGKVVVPKLAAAKAKKRKAKIVTLGKSSFSIPAGKTRKVTIKLNKAAQKLLGKRKTLKARQNVVAHDSRNTATNTSGSLRLKLARKKH